MLSKKYDFKESEQKWHNYWQENDIYKFDEKDKRPKYLIDTPPPTISGPNLHTGHVFSYTQIDVIARHKRMSGFNVYFPMGFDNNGLPSGRYVQKKYNLNPDNSTREELTEKVLEEMKVIQPIYKDLFYNLGFSCDLNNYYTTISQRTQKLSQQSFIELFNAGHVSRRKSATLFCPECRTAIASSEIETKEIESKMNYIYFGIKDSTEKLEVATTRPELLPACVCVFVNPNDKKHKHLIGKTAISPIFNKEVLIIANDEALMDKGTGVVMCCTFGDEKDMEWQKAFSLPVLEAIGQNGRMTSLAGEFEGLKIKEAREKTIEKLKELNLLYKQEDISHLVATHERCGKEIEILTKPQWFIELLSHKDEIYQKGLEVNWHPKSMQKRFLNWVEGLKWDWCISRQNFYGVPFPVWYCSKCGKIKLADIKDLPVDPTKENPKTCCECGSNEFIPEKDVFDTWATSSLTPQICMDINFNTGLNGDFLPMSLRPNAHDNIRVWDFYTIAKSLLHFGKLPWTDVMISGYAVDEKGDKISKSKGNEKLSPQKLVEVNSADATRYWASNISIGMDTVLTQEQLTNAQKLVQKIFNASKFAISFLDGAPNSQPEKMELMDTWILGKLKLTKQNFDKYMESYEMGLALKEVEKLFWNFCDNYIEIAKNRLYKPEIYGENAKKSAQYALKTVLKALLKLFSIYMPHITEEIYMDAFSREDNAKSIHTTLYTDCSKFSNENDEIGDMVCDIVSAIRTEKSKQNVSLKHEVETLTICGYDEKIKEAEKDIVAVGSIKNIVYKPAPEKSVEITLAPIE